MVHLASYAIQSLEDSYAFFDKGDEKYFDKVEKYETAVNSIDEELTTYLIEISNEFLSVYENEILVSVLDSVRDLERIVLDSIRVVVDDDKVLAGQVILRHEELKKLEKQLRMISYQTS